MAPFSTFLISLLIATQAIFTSGSPVPFEKRTVDDVKADIGTILSQVNTLNNNIKAFPDSGGSLSGALAIHKGATNLSDSISKGTTDIKNTTTSSDEEAQSILDSIKSIKPTIISTLEGIAAKKSAFDSLPISGVFKIMKQDLESLATNTNAFAGALIDAALDNLKGQAQSIADTIKDAFDKAQAVFMDA
ncbi:hydrophobic surface binding protein [Moniliophthora roreri MCA 2997]|uniref:Hydrophobic surface binding protein n=2 Tax=Moniliophthora roreri TaxID=221103 RepID=V2WL73_MONRO|nr:hydrophobic surface binding protein [Moniliophthora roreri MCA 2997]KAI3616719.1 hydrophobic surface binding protein [Moniliophthora roreri]